MTKIQKLQIRFLPFILQFERVLKLAWRISTKVFSSVSFFILYYFPRSNKTNAFRIWFAYSLETIAKSLSHKIFMDFFMIGNDTEERLLLLAMKPAIVGLMIRWYEYVFSYLRPLHVKINKKKSLYKIFLGSGGLFKKIQRCFIENN